MSANSVACIFFSGSALQQAVSALTNLNGTSYADGGAEWTTFGFEYWANPDARDEGYIEWVAGGPSFKVGAHAFAGDQSLNISDRLIPEEPMVCVIQVGVSALLLPRCAHFGFDSRWFSTWQYQVRQTLVPMESRILTRLWDSFFPTRTTIRDEIPV